MPAARSPLAPRPALVALSALALLVAVTACGSSGGSEATATPDPLTAWAGGVCASVDDLKTTVGDLGDSVTIDATDSTSAADQLKTQLDAAVTTVTTSATGVVAAVSALPPSADTALKDAQDTLKTESETVQSGIDAVKAAVADLPDTTSGAAAIKAVAQIAPLVATLALNAKQLVDAAKEYATSADAQLSEAFGDAQQCSTLRASASPS